MLRYVYPGNVRGLGDLESTRCPGSGTVVVERVGYRVGAVRLNDGACARCGLALPGWW